MSGICIVSRDRLFARMLELELSDSVNEVRTVTQKLNSPALKLAVESAELVVFDADYFSGDLSFVKKTGLPFVIFSKEKPDSLPENTVAFLERPFNVSEFREKILSFVKKDETKNTRDLSIGGEKTFSIELDPFLKQATVNGEVIRFSPKEFALLSLLYKNRGSIVSRKRVIDTLWGEDYDSANNVDNVYINYLRKKLDDRLGIKLICTVRGKGYMMK